MANACVLWRRLDAPGHDACRIVQIRGGWRLEGTAVFAEQRTVAQLHYQVCCDEAWVTTVGTIAGWQGAREVRFDITRSSDGAWSINGAVRTEFDSCFDLISV